ncbi:MAG: ABC transporter permease subunit [Christensenellaceae bacterium]|jgi:putative aldouronate transport system permease protein|nr:ABC transporter permease subunit [Christensenellaceae bacterium]
MTVKAQPSPARKGVRLRRLLREIWRNRFMYLLLVPGLLYFAVFCYGPMYGIQLAWKEFAANAGVVGSRWVGWANFAFLFKEAEFWNAIRNTLTIAGMQIALAFPFPILLAILFNEVWQPGLKRVMQIVSTFPHFLSWVILSSIIFNLFGNAGTVNNMVVAFGGQKLNFLMSKEIFRWLLLFSLIWKESGWNTILYMATISSIDQSLYEAATIDGANRFQRIVHITWPGMQSIVTATFILRVGMIMNAGYMQVLTLYNPSVYEVGDILDTYIYRITFQKAPKYGISTAVGMFKGVVNAALMLSAEAVSRRLSGEGLL